MYVKTFVAFIHLFPEEIPGYMRYISVETLVAFLSYRGKYY